MTIFKCDRCGEKHPLPTAPVPDMFADRYLDICFDCWEELIKIEGRHID